MGSKRLHLSWIAAGLGLAWGVKVWTDQTVVLPPEPGTLKVVWKRDRDEKTLKAWTPQQIEAMGIKATKERDPQNGSVVTWRGPYFNDWVTSVLEELDAQERAAVDLVIIKSQKGSEVRVPRALIQRYPFVFATSRSGKALPPERGPLMVIPPWTSRSALRLEPVPVDRYMVEQVTEVELTNYRTLFGKMYLERRSNPTALMGEKTAVQTCMSCHQAGDSEKVMHLLSEIGEKKKLEGAHQPVVGLPVLNGRSMRAVEAYIDELRAEGKSFPERRQSSL